jgi:hypothetical protein
VYRGRIILLEGADGSGKTTLALDLKNRFGARVMHGRVWKKMGRWHAGIMRRAVRLAEAGELVVLDRHWVSEHVYGPIFRGGPAYGDDVASCYDRTIRMGGAVVLCSPRDVARHLKEFERLKAARGEKFARINEVVLAYRSLASGDMHWTGGDYLGQYIRHGDFLENGGVLYDRFTYHSPIRPAAGAEDFNDYLIRRIGWTR